MLDKYSCQKCGSYDVQVVAYALGPGRREIRYYLECKSCQVYTEYRNSRLSTSDIKRYFLLLIYIVIILFPIAIATGFVKNIYASILSVIALTIAIKILFTKNINPLPIYTTSVVNELPDDFCLRRGSGFLSRKILILIVAYLLLIFSITQFIIWKSYVSKEYHDPMQPIKYFDPSKDPNYRPPPFERKI